MSMRKTVARVSLVIITLFVMVGLTGCANEKSNNQGTFEDPYKVEENNPRHAKEVGNIDWLENSNEEEFPEVKELLRKMVKEEANQDPEKVAFSYTYFHGVFYGECYYKVNGVWYEVELGENDAKSLENTLIEQDFYGAYMVRN